MGRKVHALVFTAILSLVPLPPSQAGSSVPLCFGKKATIVGSDRGETLRGTRGDDVIIGSGGADDIFGGSGNDRICGGGGSDAIHGQTGNDRISSDVGDDKTFGGPGNDVIRSGAGNIEGYNDFAHGGRGDDRLLAAASRSSIGEDRLYPGPGDDLVVGDDHDEVRFDSARRGVHVDLTAQMARGQGDDVVKGVRSVFGSRHADVLIGNDRINDLDGGPGGDVLKGLGDVDFLYDGWSREFTTDVSANDQSNDRMYGGSGNDSIDASGGDDRLAGNGGNDSLGDWGDGHEVMLGGPGTDDAMFGGEGVTASLRRGRASSTGTTSLTSIENLWGTRYDDRLVGDNGSNLIIAGVGDDVLIGGSGDDDLRPDELTFGIYGRPRSGDDRVDGGPGTDTVGLEGDNGGVTVDLATGLSTRQGTDHFEDVENLMGTHGDDVLLGDAEANVILGNQGNDRVEGMDGNDVLGGGDGNDSVSGGSGDDVISGDNGSDDLDGGPGDDDLKGGEGDDDLDGGPGDDSVDGGAGSDTCLEGESKSNCEIPP